MRKGKASATILLSWWFLMAASDAGISTVGPFQNQQQCEQTAQETNKSRFVISQYVIISKCWEASLDLMIQKVPQKSID